jgi:hypothetical protein
LYFRTISFLSTLPSPLLVATGLISSSPYCTDASSSSARHDGRAGLLQEWTSQEGRLLASALSKEIHDLILLPGKLIGSCVSKAPRRPLGQLEGSTGRNAPEYNGPQFRCDEDSR